MWWSHVCLRSKYHRRWRDYIISQTQTTCLGDQLIVIGQVGSAVDTAVCSVTVWQISLESSGFCHLHHLGWALLAQLRAGTGRLAALLGSLTKETLTDGRKSRCCSQDVFHGAHIWDERKGHNLSTNQDEAEGYGRREILQGGVFRMCVFWGMGDRSVD